MKKNCQPQLRDQQSKKYEYDNNKPKLFKKPLNKLEMYEMLRQDLLETFPNLSEDELLIHCKAIGKACGLRTYGGAYVG